MDIQSVTALALFGSVAAFYTQIKGFVLRFTSIFVKTEEVIIPNYSMFQQFLRELLSRSKVINWGNKKHLCKAYFSALDMQTMTYGFSFFDSYLLIYERRHFIILNVKDYGRMNITYLNFVFPIKKVLKELAEISETWFTKQKDTNERYLYFSVSEKEGFDMSDLRSKMVDTPSGNSSTASFGNNSGAEKSASSSSDSPFAAIDLLGKQTDFISGEYEDITNRIGYTKPKPDDYFWSEEAIQLSNEIEFWLASEKWFKDRGLSWKRGALLHGAPGGGKSKMVLQCAKKHKLHLMKVNISNMSNKEFNEAMKSAVDNNVPTLFLLEDIDVIFNGRTNILQTEGGKALVSFDTIINAINGVKNVSNIFIIATTNNMEALDAALTRSGRLDVKIKVGPLSEEGRYFIAKNILRDWPEVLEQLVKDCEGCSAADFENLCIEKAHDLFFQQRNATIEVDK